MSSFLNVSTMLSSFDSDLRFDLFIYVAVLLYVVVLFYIFSLHIVLFYFYYPRVNKDIHEVKFIFYIFFYRTPLPAFWTSFMLLFSVGSEYKSQELEYIIMLISAIFLQYLGSNDLSDTCI